MNMDELKSAVITLAEHDNSIADTDLGVWLNQGIQRINVAMKSNIALLPAYGTPPNSTIPAFDVRYHEALVVFAVMKYRESDSDYNGATYMLNKFDEMVHLMQRDMVLLPSSRLDGTVQQIVVASSTIFSYTLVMPFGSYYANLDVYQNDVWIDPINYTINQWNKTISFTGITLAVNDKITIDYELDSTTNQPPYTWWGDSGW